MKEESILVCVRCESEFELDELKSCCGAFCPKCEREKNELNILVFLGEFLKIKRRRELAKRIYCRACGHIDLIENFMRERVCPNCMSGNNINMACVKICEKCDEVPAQDNGDPWCKHCADEYNAACEVADAKYWRD